MRQSLSRRQEDGLKPACGSGIQLADYNLPLHIGALFIVLTVSASACALPIVIPKVPRLRLDKTFLFIVRHFGTGVLLATVCTHLLPTAFISLTDPCLPAFWNELYPAMTGAIVLFAIFAISIVQMIFSPGRHCCAVDMSGLCATEHAAPHPPDVVEHNDQVHQPAAISSKKNGDDEVQARQDREKARMQCVMLELGILFHSVFIGMALAVAVGDDQIVLLIAIVFHQTFEGLALGSRIAAVGWAPRAIQPWIMACAYGCTTPLGQAIGMATRNLYDPSSETGLLVVGIMNAISAGLLLFNSLVDLLDKDFLSDQSQKTLRGTRRIVAFSLMVFGAFCMSLIGAWA